MHRNILKHTDTNCLMNIYIYSNIWMNVNICMLMYIFIPLFVCIFICIYSSGKFIGCVCTCMCVFKYGCKAWQFYQFPTSCLSSNWAIAFVGIFLAKKQYFNQLLQRWQRVCMGQRYLEMPLPAAQPKGWQTNVQMFCSNQRWSNDRCCRQVRVSPDFIMD